jgi:hypothetical protein
MTRPVSEAGLVATEKNLTANAAASNCGLPVQRETDSQTARASCHQLP